MSKLQQWQAAEQQQQPASEHEAEGRGSAKFLCSAVAAVF